MTRAGALALLAGATLRQGSLLEYTPGELLVVDHRLADAPGIRVAGAPEHKFDASPFKCDLAPGVTAYGYAVDPDA